jgi:hypothetical protein
LKTKASPSPLFVFAFPMVVWNVPGVTGKFVESVWPAT